MEHLDIPNIYYLEEVCQVSHELSWIDPFIEYLIDGTLLEDPIKSHRIKQITSWYMFIEG